MSRNRDAVAKLYAYSFINIAQECTDSDANLHRSVFHNISGAVCWQAYQELCIKEQQTDRLTKEGLRPGPKWSAIWVFDDIQGRKRVSREVESIEGVPESYLVEVLGYIKKRQMRTQCLWVLVRYLGWIAVFMFTDSDING
ncbi:hypothetical protein N0V95_000509 [Ascochyta clinopodiicola]|nr:hypothetical protein N0V95_000509 [Ascochyta clinopodiicola]